MTISLGHLGPLSGVNGGSYGIVINLNLIECSLKIPNINELRLELETFIQIIFK